MPAPSPRLLRTATPAIPAARRWAAAYGGGAGPALDLTQAVPGYPPHPELLERLAAAAARPANAGYGPIEGERALREALADDLSRSYGAAIGPDDVAITAGCNLAFTMAATVVAGSGEAVLLPTPWYFNHRMALEMAGIGVVPLPCRAEEGFLADPEAAAALLDRHPAIRAIVLITPNNPTGAILSPERLERFAQLARERDVWLILDETYRDFLPEAGAAPHALFQATDWRDRVVQLYSFSKSYCVPGHRLGAITAGGAFRAELLKALDTFQICPGRAPQEAVAWAVPGLRPWRDANRQLMAERAAAFAAIMATVPTWRVEAIGAYFAYLRIPDGLPDAEAVAERLAAEAGLMVLPGSFFGPGQERHLRVAFANAPEDALRAVPARLRALGA
ncbi:aminotransferase [Roseomonas elaeocarpi]|uniref:aspartate transaminase n=1 Tax=Roseomonas elaeocarpi TaxID=907779 RepID=A0ABV6JTX2_9PROT